MARSTSGTRSRALTSIALDNGVTLEGRALARNGEVTMINDTIDSSSCAAPSPNETPTAAPTQAATTAPEATTRPTVTAPPTDTVASVGAGSADGGVPLILVLLAVAAVAVMGALDLRTRRSRTRD